MAETSLKPLAVQQAVLLFYRMLGEPGGALRVSMMRSLFRPVMIAAIRLLASRRSRAWQVAAALLLACQAFGWAVPPAETRAATISLSGPLLNGDVLRFAVTPDGQTVIFTSDERVSNFPELYRVPIWGGAPVRLSAPLTVTKRLHNFYLTADSRWIVYSVEHPQHPVDPYEQREIYRHPIDDSTGSVRLSHAFAANTGIPPYGFSVSRDGRYVVYRVCAGACEIFSVPINGTPTSVKLNYTLPPGGTIWLTSISRDSRRVVYLGEQDVNEQSELYSVPINGPASAAVKLSVPIDYQQDIMPEYLSFFRNDSGRVFYYAWPSGALTQNLFSVPIAGDGPSVPLFVLPPPGQPQTEGFVSADANGLITYAAELDPASGPVFYSVPMVGPAGARLQRSQPISPGLTLHSNFGVSRQGQHLVFVACANCSTNWPDYAIYSAPLTGSAPASYLLAENLGSLFGLAFSPDGQYLIYSTHTGTYQVPIEGPSSAAELISLVTGQLQWSPGDCYLMARTSDQWLHLWPYGENYTDTVQIVGPIGLDIAPYQQSFAFGGLASRLVYLADNGSGHDELYAAETSSCFTEKNFLPRISR